MRAGDYPIIPLSHYRWRIRTCVAPEVLSGYSHALYVNGMARRSRARARARRARNNSGRPTALSVNNGYLCGG